MSEPITLADLHDAKVLAIGIHTQQQPCSLTVSLRIHDGRPAQIVFPRCCMIEGRILGGVLAIPESFDGIMEREVQAELCGVACAGHAYELLFTGGSSLLVTAEGFEIES